MTEILQFLITIIKNLISFIKHLFIQARNISKNRKNLPLFYAILAGIVGAIIVHIIFLFFIPHFEKYNAFEELEKNTEAYQFTTLHANSSITKAADPLFKQKACRFNLADGPVHVYADGITPFWSMSIYNQFGINLYSLNDRTTPNDMLDLVIGTPAHIMQLKQTPIEGIANAVFVTENIAQGFIILRNYNENVENIENSFLENAICRPLINIDATPQRP